MKQLLLLVILATSATFAAAQTPSKAEQELKQFLEKYAKAQFNLDADTMASMLSDDLILSDGNGNVSDKAKSLASIRANVRQGQYDDYHYEDVVIHVYGNAAAINLVIVSKGSTKNGPFNSRGRGTGMFVKQKGQWQAVAIHTSTIKQP